MLRSCFNSSTLYHRYYTPSQPPLLCTRCLCEDDVPVSQTNSSRCGLDPLLLRAKRDALLSRDLVTGEESVIIDGISGGNRSWEIFIFIIIRTCILYM